MKPRSLPEVPTKLDNGPQHRQLLVAMREQITQLTGRLAVPATPTNVTVTPQSFQNLISWSKSNDADYYEVRASATPNINDGSAVTVDAGDSQQYQDTVGNNVARYYWVRSRKLTGAASQWSSVAKGTALASGTGVTPPTPPPAGTSLVQDQTTGQPVPANLPSTRTLTQN